jgi:hypothetical protein
LTRSRYVRRDCISRPGRIILGAHRSVRRSIISRHEVDSRFRPSSIWTNERTTRNAAILAVAVFFLLAPSQARAQGGPPYYTNDPGTPGDRNWEINLAYMPFLYNGRATTHMPDVDINYGVGDRIQLTYENAWLRVKDSADAVKYGLGQDQLGVKWRFYDNKDTGLAISIFPQLSINNPDHSVQRGITPPGSSLIMPVEFSKKVGPLDVNWEVGYNAVHLGPDGWIAGLVVGRDISKKLELDAEFYGLGAFNDSNNQQTLGAGARYKVRPSLILLLMAGRSVAPAHNNQPCFVGYFGIQFWLPPKQR